MSRFANGGVVLRPRHLVLRSGSFSILVQRRSLRACMVMLLAIVVLAVGALLIGDYALSVPEALRALLGGGSDPLATYFVQEQRAPRILCALLVGAALGVSGGIFQQLTGNALGSPDIIGFTTGAATGALLQIIVFGGGQAAIGLAALAGAFGTVLVVYLLAWRDGLAGYRLVLVGIGVAAILQALNTLLSVRASLTEAQTAAQWLAGSFNAASWTDVAVIGVALAVVLLVGFGLARQLSVMVMGDDLAHGLGVGVERARLGLVVAGVALVAVATSVCGPIAFIALAAPSLARRLTGSTNAALAPAALMGAVLVLASDILAQRLFAPDQLAVGVVSGSLGGLYLIWLLARDWRRRSA